MSEQTIQLVEVLRKKLVAARNKFTRVRLVTGLTLLAGAASLLWLLFTVAEMSFWLPAGVRTAVIVLVALAVGTVAVRWLIVPILFEMGVLGANNELQVAKRIGRRFPEVGDRLVNVLQLSGGAHSGSPGPFVDRAVRNLGEPLRNVPFEEVESYRSSWNTGRLALIPLCLLFVFLVAAPGPFLSASSRLLHPRTTFERPAPFSFIVKPGDAELITGGSIAIRANVRGVAELDGVLIETNVLGEVRSRTVDMIPDDGSWLHMVENVRQPFKYRVLGGDVQTPWYDVQVVDRPQIQQLSVQITPPTYTRLPARRLDSNVGDFSALRGSTVEINLVMGGSRTDTGSINFESGRKVDLVVDGSGASASFTVGSSDGYSVHLQNLDGVSNSDPIAYRIESVQDASPAISFLSPEALFDLDDDRMAPLLLHITDDFGFHDLTLYFRLADSRFGQISEQFSSLEIPLPSRMVLDQEVPFDWMVAEQTPLEPVPGDAIEYYVEIRDNDGVTGFKAAQTRVYRLRVPSLAEQYESLDQNQNRTEDSLKEVTDEAKRIKDQFNELKDNLRQKPESDWQDERLLEQLQEKQQNMENAVEDVSSQMEELSQQMNQNDLVSEETMDMFSELKKVVDEVQTPELMDALKDLQQAMQDMDMNRMQEALEKFDFNEEMYQKRLDRTLNLFKQVRLNQDMDEVEKRAQDLAETEDRLAEETAKLENEQNANEDDGQQAENATGENKQPGEENERLAEEQEMTAEEMKALEDKMEEVLDRMEDLKNTPSQEMQDLLEDTQDKKMPEQMENNAEQLRQNDLQDAKKGQQQMSEQLQQMSGQMSNMQMNMSGAQMQINTAAIRAALEDVLMLSVEQESLRTQVTDLASDSPLLRSAAQKQTSLSESLIIVSDSLQRVANEVPQMSREVQKQAGDALREMASAVEAMTERANRRAAGHQRGSMTSLNELALMLSDLLNQMMNGQGGNSNMSMEQLMDQLQNMGQQQQQINQQVQQLLNDMQGNRLTNDMTERLRQLGSQQEKIRQDLRQLSRNRELRNKVMGDLNRIAEQMQETITELQQSQVNRRTVQRQQQILTRLLEASRSLQERGEDKKRESRTAEELFKESPADLTPSEQLERLRRDLIRALETGYSTDYESLIRRYFDLLQQDESASDEGGNASEG